jgi:hypothetical protein
MTNDIKKLRLDRFTPRDAEEQKMFDEIQELNKRASLLGNKMLSLRMKYRTATARAELLNENSFSVRGLHEALIEILVNSPRGFMHQNGLAALRHSLKNKKMRGIGLKTIMNIMDLFNLRIKFEVKNKELDDYKNGE